MTRGTSRTVFVRLLFIFDRCDENEMRFFSDTMSTRETRNEKDISVHRLSCCLGNDPHWLTNILSPRPFTTEMPRGSEAKLRRRNQRKDEDKQDLNAIFGDPNGEETDEVPLPPRMKNAAPVDDHDSEEEAPPAMPKKKKGKAVPIGVPPPSSKGGIKRAPLILLILMTGTTLLPALLYAGDFLSSFLAKSNITGGLGYRMGIGHVPRKRVLSFYEKHAPEKVNDVP